MPTTPEQQAIHEPLTLEPYNPAWPTLFLTEQSRLRTLAPSLLAIEHIGSTSVPGLSAKPIIDILAAVPSLQLADDLLPHLCASGYITSPAYNLTLQNRRWLMRHHNGRRTHHLHLLLASSPDWTNTLHFRNLLRQNQPLQQAYTQLKQTLAATYPNDRESYTSAKTTFITSTLQSHPQK
ncbi:MAG TPA: GrpB family protein [Tepidisphaeraceae bacterium]|jgi:GrpB-like predicted nucleotidyltransferase (UPF0157 family)|nr:GrpB family protein [Tepidisphaeraceae bacterium]